MLDDQPRATHYGPPANRVLAKLGLLEKIREQGIEVGGARWRKPDGTVLAKILNSNLGDDPDRISCLPLNHLCRLALDDLEKEPLATIRWDHRVDEIRHDDDQARLVVTTPDGVKDMTADYVVGCDGANSIIRRQLFGGEFPGYTWDLTIIATNVYYDFAKHGWKDSNFVIHPEDYFMAAHIQKDGLWRVSYGEVPGLTVEEYKKRQPAKYEAMLPGNPKPGEYKITNFSPYKVHQRLAPKMRVGRFLLAGDSAHLCNPFGGMGLTGGLVDVGDLFDCLKGIHDGRATPEILDKYDHFRREKYNQFTNPVSESNLKRMSSDPDVVEANDPGLAMMREADKSIEASKAFQLGVLGLAHDMTQYYNDNVQAA
ncbi:hypothetical protein NM208_g5688 [Fusarium decemcellulare]|uniref:Uncharacterized protein n=1 Tax=Fusarium decemcellulare TaxID=57161 RepID=A0ACC1SGA0_9HYPO|nr:hypothetical protein NM208_g5688 [Fusarium decemcellulare]